MADKKPVAFCLRHGETTLNTDGVFRGMLDPELDKRGILQAHAAAKYLKKENIERIISSPLLRAVQTAEIIAASQGGRCVQQDRELFPWQLASLYGKDKDEYAKVLDRYIDHPKEVPVDGESLDAFQERVDAFFDAQINCHCLTLFVCHTSNIVALTDLIHGTSKGRPESGEVVEPGGICAIYETDDGYDIKPVLGATDTEEEDVEYAS
jgi:broad specificity phosphatase PhoE